MYQAEEKRYETMKYHRCGASGLMLPELSLGLWHNTFVSVARRCHGVDEPLQPDTGVHPVSASKMQKLDREKTVVNLYVAGHPIDEIWRASGFRSRSSVFRILNKHGIKLNRGNHSGPIKKRDAK